MRMLSLSALAVLVAAAGVASAETELKNDSFETGATVAIQGGFAAGEIAASRFMVASPVKLMSVRLIFANESPGGTSRDVTLHVWTDDQGSNDPAGGEVFNGDFTLMPSQNALQDLNVAAENILLNGYFRVGIEFQHTGPPSIANDIDGYSVATGSMLKSNQLGWKTSQFYGVSGDWILRAIVADPSGTPDAGVTIDASNGSPDASVGPDAGTGGQCNGNGDCELGEYCDTAAHACTFDCRHDSDCPNDGECNSLGQCVGATDGGGGCCSTGSGGADGQAALAALGLAGLVGAIVTRRRRRTGDGAETGSTRA